MAAAHITSTVLHAALKAVIISQEQSSYIKSALVVNNSKIRRAKLKISRYLKRCSTDDDPIKSLYFDGRLDETETPTLVAEPNAEYVGHVDHIPALQMMRLQLFSGSSSVNSVVDSMR